MNITDRFDNIKNLIPSDVKVVAVSKTKPAEDIQKLYNHGHKIFGENKVQELVTKKDILPKDIEWHMIGHLQTNKVKYIADFVSLIHGVDSFKLLVEINKQAANRKRIIDCLFQVHIAKEETKYGLTEEELMSIITSDELRSLKNICIKGLMGMATFTENQNTIRSEFRSLKDFFDKLKHGKFSGNNDFSILSMGMSDDYMLAIEEGSNMVRIGSSIFGERNYIN